MRRKHPLRFNLGLLVLCGLLYSASCLVNVQWAWTSHLAVAIRSGEAWLTNKDNPMSPYGTYLFTPGLRASIEPRKPRFLFAPLSYPFERTVALPIVIPLGLVMVASLLLWWRDARSMRRCAVSACLVCGYDARGLTTCPECGQICSESSRGA